MRQNKRKKSEYLDTKEKREKMLKLIECTRERGGKRRKKLMGVMFLGRR